MITPTVRVGQIWVDNDPRCKKTRSLRVDSLLQENVRDPEFVPYAICTVLETGRPVKILLSRFKPTRSGYRLITSKTLPVSLNGITYPSPPIFDDEGFATSESPFPRLVRPVFRVELESPVTAGNEIRVRSEFDVLDVVDNQSNTYTRDAQDFGWRTIAGKTAYLALTATSVNVYCTENRLTVEEWTLPNFIQRSNQ
jgi:hypothetical protein